MHPTYPILSLTSYDILSYWVCVCWKINQPYIEAISVSATFVYKPEYPLLVTIYCANKWIRHTIHSTTENLTFVSTAICAGVSVCAFVRGCMFSSLVRLTQYIMLEERDRLIDRLNEKYNMKKIHELMAKCTSSVVNIESLIPGKTTDSKKDESRVRIKKIGKITVQDIFKLIFKLLYA